ncbi:hypothetical protein [Acinetobacter sp. MD2]|uniref:hypothetical protein n=1 Tax=Acinetobacter sp. MD2 TaxID=2600066 RepID=UPI002D1EA9EC|nr:hypothetical protein [Acinetobacter sp. MD2]MEB3766462.1 hypothetical protein [Acinetobacter sp. MD2]
MKKIFASVAVLSLALASASAMACPKGSSLQGGTGPHHKGGKCVASAGVKKDKSAVKTQKTKTEAPAPTAKPKV